MKSAGYVFGALTLGISTFVIAQGVRETLRVDLVSVWVDVRTADGGPIRDLTPGELKLRVDGKEVPGEGLDRVTGSLAGLPVALGGENPKGTGKPPAVTPTASSHEVPGPEVPRSSDLYLAILIDDTAISSLDRRDLFRQLEAFLANKVPVNVHVLLERFDQRLYTECAWTTDTAKVLAAVKTMARRTATARMPSPAALADEIRNGRKAKDIELQVDLASRRSFDGIMLALLQFPAAASGRKALVVVTDGTPLMTPFDLSLMLSGQNAGARDSESLRAQMLRGHGDEEAAKQVEMQLQDDALSTLDAFGPAASATWVRRMATISKKAVELDIAFYPVDSEAIDRGTNPGVASKWPGRAMPGVQSGAALPVAASGMSARIAVAQSMRALADISGGQAILVPQQLAARLGTLASEQTDGYALTFRDPSPNDHRFHRVEITVVRPGTTASYRHGYRLRTDDERTLDAIVGNLQQRDTNNPSNPLQVKASFDLLRTESGRDTVMLRLEYTQLPEARGAIAREREIQVWAVCADDDGNRAAPLGRKATAQHISDATPDVFADSLQLALPPGPYTWSIALKDLPTGVTSFLVVRTVL